MIEVLGLSRCLKFLTMICRKGFRRSRARKVPMMHTFIFGKLEPDFQNWSSGNLGWGFGIFMKLVLVPEIRLCAKRTAQKSASISLEGVPVPFSPVSCEDSGQNRRRRRREERSPGNTNTFRVETTLEEVLS